MSRGTQARLAEERSLGHILATCKLLPTSQVRRWTDLAASENVALETLLEREGVLPRTRQLQILENYFFCPAIDVRQVAYDARHVGLLPYRLAKRHQALVVGIEGKTVAVAFAHPDDEVAASVLAHTLQHSIRRLAALPGDLCEAIESHYARLRDQSARAERGAKPGGDAPCATQRAEVPPVRCAVPAGGLDCSAELTRHGQNAVAIADELLELACRHDATDVHIEPERQGLAVRFRIDGILHRVVTLPETLAPAVASRFKVLAQMDIAEHRMPQDGRYSIQKGDLLVDLRLSSLPSQFGEKVVVRLLKKNVSLLDLGNLQMPAEVRALHQDMIGSPFGFFLVTGPTGSGKTTTLYSTLAALDRQSLNVITLEDPIEYSLQGITQVQINDTIGLTFARCLQSILRQDPDVILVGEIRNSETVEIACRAALTGHKVFSTLHTTDSTQAVARLLDMGCVPYLITSTLRGVLAQRLVRLICAACREPYAANPTELAILGQPGPHELQRGRGCPECAGTGYKGRMALFEYFRMDEKYHRLVLDRASSYAIRHAARRDGMVTMAEYAKRAVLDGLTTVTEVERSVLADHGREQLCAGCHRVVSIEFSVCPYCKAVLRENCPHCSQPVEPNWEVCATCGKEIEREWQRSYCPRCDAPQDPRWSACPYCGCDVS